jgi:hypothetical protein
MKIRDVDSLKLLWLFLPPDKNTTKRKTSVDPASRGMQKVASVGDTRWENYVVRIRDQVSSTAIIVSRNLLDIHIEPSD